MKKTVLLFALLIVVVSCGSRQSTSRSEVNLRNLSSSYDGKISEKTVRILREADRYLGVPYQFGGSSMKGLDCSGLLLNVFSENRIKLPRRSQDQAQQGKRIDVEEVKPGDLLFFATKGNRTVSHVGLVREIRSRGEIAFIHASTSKGVIISSLNDRYWNKAFLFARRIL